MEMKSSMVLSCDPPPAPGAQGGSRMVSGLPVLSASPQADVFTKHVALDRTWKQPPFADTSTTENLEQP
jgi:hypothetical protein